MIARSIAVGACGATAFIDMYATQPLLPTLRTEFGASEAAVGLTVSATTLACAAAAPFVGSLADSLGRKRVIVAAIVLLGFVTLGASSAPSLGALIAWRAAQGVLMPGIFAVTLAYIAEEFPAAAIGRGTAAYITGNALGGFLGRYVTALVAERANWHVAFVVLGALTFAGAVFVFAALPRSVHFRRSTSVSASGRALAGFVRDPAVLATYAMGATVLFTMVAAFTFATFYLAAPPLGLSTAAIGNVFFVWLLALVATPLGGRLIDRLGNRRTTLGALGVAMAGLLLTLVPRLPWIVAGLAILSSAIFVMQTSSQSFLGRIVHGNRSTAALRTFRSTTSEAGSERCCRRSPGRAAGGRLRLRRSPASNSASERSPSSGGRCRFGSDTRKRCPGSRGTGRNAA